MTTPRRHVAKRFIEAFVLFLGLAGLAFVSGEELFAASADKNIDWPKAMLRARTDYHKARAAAVVRAGVDKTKLAVEEKSLLGKTWKSISRVYPREEIWVRQDTSGGFPRWFNETASTRIEIGMIRKVCEELGEAGSPICAELRTLVDSRIGPNDRRWLALYQKGCELRRAARLAPIWEHNRRFVFIKRHDTAVAGHNHYAYTESLSDIQHQRYFTFRPGSSLCLLDIDGSDIKMQTLIDDTGGVLRDPDVSPDGLRLLFSWKKSARGDDYHLYEMDLATRKIRQLTDGLGYADFEGIYLPDGNILFHSTRCVQTVDCDMNEVSNLYLSDGDGQNIRRVGFDQVHTTFPCLLPDGRVIFTRWDYNDRSQVWAQGLIQMNPNGTGQTEYYGNNSWFPTAIHHARAIPGSSKLIAVLGGHHAHQRGKLALLDRRRGRQEASGVQLVAPPRKTDPVRVDVYGQDGEQYKYPFALDERNYLVSYTPEPTPNRVYNRPLGIYWISIDGRKELLVNDRTLGCYQIVPIVARDDLFEKADMVDHRSQTGTYMVQDIYAGPGLAGIPRGTVKRLRVVAIEYRPANIGHIRCSGPGGTSNQHGPVAVGNGTYDVKKVLGTVDVCEDGSALFEVPARTPVFFQALDARGHVVQSMRSWSTLQPGEYFGCVGCHENKAATPKPDRLPFAMTGPAQKIELFYGPPRGFSYRKEIQPIWDRHCIGCHRLSPGEKALATDKETAFSLLGKLVAGKKSQRIWAESYLMLTRADKDETGHPNDLVNWLNVQSVPSILPPYYRGACKSRLITLLDEGHYDVQLSREEMDKIACWIDLLVPFCGDYAEAANWGKQDRERYERLLGKRRKMESLDRASRARLMKQTN
ncbi:MAG: hypothetical protein U9N87_00830 [Planctomycetota bacterium]|nr:hypothetical protein [Planctomycetota bacterium]